MLAAIHAASDLRTFSAIVLGASAAILGTAFAFQSLGGLEPCALCVWQRYPYGAAIGLLAVTLVLALHGGFESRDVAVRSLIALAGVVFLGGAGLAAYHVGVEQHLWAGTAACGVSGGPAPTTLEELQASLREAPAAPCDEIAWSLLGISMAGYNLILSLLLACACLARARRPAKDMP